MQYLKGDVAICLRTLSCLRRLDVVAATAKRAVSWEKRTILLR